MQFLPAFLRVSRPLWQPITDVSPPDFVKGAYRQQSPVLSHGAVVITLADRLERWLLPLLVLVTASALILPGAGRSFDFAVLPLFAVLMGAVSLTFDVGAVRASFLRRRGLVFTLALVYVPLGIGGYLIGTVLFGPGPVADGLALLGALPTDISAPLFTSLSRGNTALAAVFNAVDTSLAPVVLPPFLLLVTGLAARVPVSELVGELLFVVVVPTVFGVWLRTSISHVAHMESGLRAVAILAYLALVGIVVSGQAVGLRSLGSILFPLLFAVLALNLAGYALGWLAWRLAHGPRHDLPAYVFVLGEKEFSVAAAVVYAAGLDRAVLVPSLVAAAVQMVTAAYLARGFKARAGV